MVSSVESDLNAGFRLEIVGQLVVFFLHTLQVELGVSQDIFLLTETGRCELSAIYTPI